MRYKSPKIKKLDIHQNYKYERKFIFVVYSFFYRYPRLNFKFSASYLHNSFFGEFSKFYMEIIWRFKCLMVEFKCLVSWVIALYTSALLNKWNLQFCFLDFRIIFLANIFLKFFQCLLGRKALFFCSETKKNSSFFFWTHFGQTFWINGRQQEKSIIIYM